MDLPPTAGRGQIFSPSPLNIFVFLSGISHVALMTVRVGDDKRAAGRDKILCRSLGRIVLFDFLLHDNLGTRKTEFLSSSIDTVDVSF